MNEEEKEWISQALMEDERKRCISKVLKLEAKDAVAKGNNFISDIFRLNLKVVLNSGECEERSVIYKIIPREEGNKLPDVKKSGLFIKEGRVYTEVLPEMERLLRNVHPNAEAPWPQIYGLKRNFEGFLLEDVSVLGYKMADRVEGLDFEHVSLALQKLALFHALAAVLIERGDISTHEFNAYHFHKEEGKMQKMMDQVIDSMVKVIEENWKEEWLEYVDGLKQLKKTFVKKLIEIQRRDDKKFNTLNHGDFWSNNVLFKYDADGRPQNIMILDYQLAFANTPSFDLQYFLNVSLKPEFFDRKSELLNIYYSSLKSNLELHDYSGDIPSFEEMKESYEETIWFGWHAALYLRPFMGCNPLDELVKKHKGDVDIKSVEYDELMYLCRAYGSEKVTFSLKHCLKEMKEYGFL